MTQARHFNRRPQCPECKSVQLRENIRNDRKFYTCVTCRNKFPAKEASYAQPFKRRSTGSGVVAGPCYHRGLLFPGRKRAAS